jgi:hypothetical protein
LDVINNHLITFDSKRAGRKVGGGTSAASSRRFAKCGVIFAAEMTSVSLQGSAPSLLEASQGPAN